MLFFWRKGRGCEQKQHNIDLKTRSDFRYLQEYVHIKIGKIFSYPQRENKPINRKNSSNFVPEGSFLEILQVWNSDFVPDGSSLQILQVWNKATWRLPASQHPILPVGKQTASAVHANPGTDDRLPRSQCRALLIFLSEGFDHTCPSASGVWSLFVWGWACWAAASDMRGVFGHLPFVLSLSLWVEEHQPHNTTG